MFSIISILALMLGGLDMALFCLNDISFNTKEYIGNIHTLIYILDAYLLLVLSFIRIHYVFRGTSFQLTKCTVTIHMIAYIMLPILLFFSIVPFSIISSSKLVGIISNIGNKIPTNFNTISFNSNGYTFELSYWYKQFDCMKLVIKYCIFNSTLLGIDELAAILLAFGVAINFY